MKALLLIPAAAGILLAGCGQSSSPANPPSTNNAATNFASGNPLTAVPDYLGAVGGAQKFAVKQIDLSYLHEAIEQFDAAEGRYPKDLNELVQEKYLSKIPAAPYGMKIDYDPATGAVKVVSQ